MIEAAQHVERGGADLVLLCTNTMHKMAEEVQQAIHIPLLHIADATAEKIKAQRLKQVGLLGTRFTMEEDFYKGRLTGRHGLEVIVPNADERALVDRVIYDELVLGEIKPDSRAHYLRIVDGLVRKGAEGVILGCTEIGLLLQAEAGAVPLFDTTRIHAVAAVEYALA
jgi:aspartate racemase